MSGSGGGYEPPQRTKFDCETSIIITNVSSVDMLVLEKHKKGNTLEVILGSKESLLLEDGDGEILGAVLHINTSDIIDCIKNGASYEAEILDINSPACRVRIKRPEI
ncbi:hypothetical protein [Flavobacterium quisquiliarum]|uniref:Uncharacterized protein n=1 Tax=Flavobacterium quisquiliarum TaxID=1834436 RepID=A0ABV8W7X0_9FLAO|nr:hypothetical protein [Flavobacterium quisquiliarum]MBW1656477.1 hypothetical protein [Flavobacterium quisquiliarum]NWL03854.1 hypothetical protein [Flavobacterium collinsii]